MVVGTNNTITLATSNKNGCIATSTRNIILRDGVDAPTAFTPDGDGLNDEFSVRFEEILVEFEIEIFNRWGLKVFEIENYDNNLRVLKDGLILSSTACLFYAKKKATKLKPPFGFFSSDRLLSCVRC